MELITAAYCLPIDCERIQNGGIVIDNEKIVAVGTADELAAKYPEAKRTDYPEQVLLPGLINAHLHIDLAHFRCPRPHPAQSALAASPHVYWLKQSFEARHTISVDSTLESINRCLKQMVQNGVTCVGAMTNYDGTANLIDKSGLRAVVFPELYGGGPTGLSQDRFESTLAIIEENADQPNNGRVKLGFGPLAPYLLSRNLLQIISSYAKADSIPVQLHAAESFDEMEFFYNSSGPIGTDIFPLLGWGEASEQALPPPFRKTPVNYLEEIGILAAHPSIVGCVQLSASDIPKLKKNGCRVVFSPRAIRDFGLGEFPYGKLVEEDVPVALGTESAFDSTDGDLWDEMRIALEMSGISPKEILTMSTLGGAKALGWENNLGSLSIGKQADYIIIDLPPLSSAEDLTDALIRNTTSKSVRKTVVNNVSLKSA